MRLKKMPVYIFFLVLCLAVLPRAGAQDIKPSGSPDSGLYHTADGSILVAWMYKVTGFMSYE